MKLLPLVLIAVALLLGAAGDAQIVYVDTAGIGLLKKTTTLFVVPEADSTLKAGFEQAINSAWKLTTYKIISADELAQYKDKKGYSFFCELCFGSKPAPTMHDTYSANDITIVPFNGDNEIRTFHSGGPHRGRRSKESDVLGVPDGKGYYSYYCLFTTADNGIGIKTLQRYADIKIGGATGPEPTSPIYKKSAKQNRKDNLMDNPYWNPYWSPGLLKTYLAILSNGLGAATNQHDTAALYPFSNSEDAPAMAHLVTDTLYIPDYIENAISAGLFDKMRKGITDEGVAGVYPYPYRLVTSGQLSGLILNSGRAVNFLTYIPYFPVLFRYDGEKSKYSRSTAVISIRKLPSGGRAACKGIKVYNSEKGIIYANYPMHTGIGSSTVAITSFSKEDLKAVADAVK